MPQRSIKKTGSLFIIGAVTCMSIVLAAIYLHNQTPQEIYDRAKRICDTEIYLIERDAVWTDIRVVSKPYPSDVKAITGETVIDFACDKASAERKR